MMNRAGVNFLGSIFAWRCEPRAKKSLQQKEELSFSLLMAGYFFLVITSFWILKPIKKSEFIAYYKEIGAFNLFGWQMLGSQAELLAKVLNMVVAAAAVAVFTLLCRKFVRQQLTYVFPFFHSMPIRLFCFARKSRRSDCLDVLFVRRPF
jgi:hypothetical protein